MLGRLRKACEYYGVPLSSAVGRSLAASLAASAMLYLLAPRGASAALAAAVTFASVAFLSLQYYVLKYEAERLAYERFAPLAARMFAVAYAMTGSVFEACLAVAEAGIPRISDGFRSVVEEVSGGVEPRGALARYLSSCPSRSLEASVLATLERGEGGALASQGAVAEFVAEYEQLGARAAVVLAVLFFAPMLALLAASLYWKASGPELLLIVPLHVSLGTLASRLLFPKGEALL